MKFTIISTMYCSAPYLLEFYERTVAAVEEVSNDFELILVNDGSPDESLDLALGLQDRDSRVVVVDLTRNFGHHAAIVAGLEYAGGDYVFLIDCDLQEQPEWLPEFFSRLEEHNCDVVYGVQEKRSGGAVARLAGDLFWRVFTAMSNVPIPKNPMTCRVMRRNYVDSLLAVEDRVLHLAGVFAWTGYRQEGVPCVKSPRPDGDASSYNLARKMVHVADAFVSFSSAPLIAVFGLGSVIWFASIVYGAVLFVKKIANPEEVLSGFTSLMLSVWFLNGTIILVLGIIGVYIAKIFQEVKQRPRFLVKHVYRKKNRGDGKLYRQEPKRRY